LKPSILDFTQDELGTMFPPSFRAKQIFHWIYQKHVDTFDDMQNIPKTLRNELSDRFVISPLTLLKKEVSRDGSIKYLFGLEDGHTVETVLLKMKDEEYDETGAIRHQARYTVCVSSQVGCKVGCAFCLTAKGGFVRDSGGLLHVMGDDNYGVIFLKLKNQIFNFARRYGIQC